LKSFLDELGNTNPDLTIQEKLNIVIEILLSSNVAESLKQSFLDLKQIQEKYLPEILNDIIQEKQLDIQPKSKSKPTYQKMIQEQMELELT
jgi:hypothetical protein